MNSVRRRNKNECCKAMLLVTVLMLMMVSMFSSRAQAQQFNSDNWWMSPHGTVSTIATVGEHYSLLMNTWAFAPNWEFSLGATLFDKDELANTTNHFSATSYFKYGFYENAAKTGGASIMAGTGVNPGYLQAGTVTKDLKSYWVALPVTIPFIDGTISWDIMPGWMLNKEQGASKEEASGFTWSSRASVYKVIPESAIVGEVFGAEGDIESEAQYKAGVRWESDSVIVALTYGAGLDGSDGGGIELGIMVLSPQFLCFGACK